MSPSHLSERLQATRIGCISTSRADAGIYQPLLEALSADSSRRVFFLAGGTHLSSAFGDTLKDLSLPSRVEIVLVDHFTAGDSPRDVAATCGRAVTAFAEALARCELDLVFVLGDRTEMLAATLAAMIATVPIAHLHGGDLTQGAYDDVCRHAITKLSHVHFPALEEHADRIRAMSEESWRVHTVGALAIDRLKAFKPLSIAELSSGVGMDFSHPTYVVVFHPQTLAETTAEQQVEELTAALRNVDANLLIMGGNADVGHQAISDALAELTRAHPKAKLIKSLPQELFWSCLSQCRVLIGNSSTALLEAPSLRLPAVNIGDRQAGRVRAANVVDTPCERNAITVAIQRAASPAFHESLVNIVNPYGDGHAAERILRVLKELPNRATLLRKNWPMK